MKKDSANKIAKTKKNNKLKAFVLIFLVAAFSGVALLQYSGYLRILIIEADLRERLRKEEKRREELLERQKYADEDEFAIEIARSRLGMLYDNEYKVIVEK
jgi:cell division protein FtsB